MVLGFQKPVSTRVRVAIGSTKVVPGTYMCIYVRVLEYGTSTKYQQVPTKMLACARFCNDAQGMLPCEVVSFCGVCPAAGIAIHTYMCVYHNMYVCMCCNPPKKFLVLSM